METARLAKYVLKTAALNRMEKLPKRDVWQENTAENTGSVRRRMVNVPSSHQRIAEHRMNAAYVVDAP